MSDPLSWKDKYLAFLAVVLLLATVAKANDADFYYSYPRCSHISGIYPLYSIDKVYSIDKDTGWLSPAEERIASKYVRREKNSSLTIVVPASRGRYKIRFFDQQEQFLFEIGYIRDSLLIVEKMNFRHAGLFQYELFKDNTLVEKNSFIIKTDP
ncbi:MAG TPA: hypothetical protein VHD83_04630 [Puia sp.]|nr:hypothetical protein [Puia sp.]